MPFGPKWLGITTPQATEVKIKATRRQSGISGAFVLPNNFLGSRHIAHFFRRCTGVRVTAVRRVLSATNVHVVLEFQGYSFEVWEPYGDSSDLVVSTVPDVPAPDSVVDSLEAAVADVWPLSIESLRRWFRQLAV